MIKFGTLILPRLKLGDTLLRSVSHFGSFGSLPNITESDVALKEEMAVSPRQFERSTVETSDFIPTSKFSLARTLAEDADFFTERERQPFMEFVNALDVTVGEKFRSDFDDLKVLFEPLNADSDAPKSRISRAKLGDHEFWFIEKLADILKQANFKPLPRLEVEDALNEHDAREGVRVKVNTDDYAVLRFWVLGEQLPPPLPPIYKQIFRAFLFSPAAIKRRLQLKSTFLPKDINTDEMKFLHPPLYQQLWRKLLRQSPMEALKFYKRVFIVCRLKADDKLTVKAFKNIPHGALEQLLPDCQIMMSRADRYLLGGFLGFGSLTIGLSAISLMSKLGATWVLVLSGASFVVAFRSWTVYKNRRNAYLLRLFQTIYFNNTANNKGAIFGATDRAHDETVKALLLTYAFLYTNRPPSENFQQHLQGGLESMELKHKIEHWLHDKYRQRVCYNPQNHLELLQSLGIVSKQKDDFFVTDLQTCVGKLASSELTQKTLPLPSFVQGYEKEVF